MGGGQTTGERGRQDARIRARPLTSWRAYAAHRPHRPPAPGRLPHGRVHSGGGDRAGAGAGPAHPAGGERVRPADRPGRAGAGAGVGRALAARGAGGAAGRGAGEREGPVAAARPSHAARLAGRVRAGRLGGGRALGGPASGARRGVPRQDDDARVRLEGGHRLAADRDHPQSVRHLAHRGRLQRRQRGGGGARRGPAVAGHGRRGQHPDPGRVLRDLRAEADVRQGAAVSGEPVRHAGPRRADGPGRGRRGAAARRRRRAGRPRLVGAAARAWLLHRRAGRGRAGAAGGVLAVVRRAGGGGADGRGGGTAGGGLDGGRRPAWAVVRAAGAVVHARLAQLPVAAGPACGGGVADLEAFRGPPQRPAVVHDTPGQTQPPSRRQRGVTVGHEGLLAVGGRCRNPHRTQKALTCSSTQHACHQRPGTAHLGRVPPGGHARRAPSRSPAGVTAGFSGGGSVEARGGNRA
ncbi:putative Aspartyl-tRNA(Asn) amidotransferase subunit A @ Glutamyl-tRNA(Gln) amidotransferase subunit A [Streptomyces misionensis JCM 4497]